MKYIAFYSLNNSSDYDGESFNGKTGRETESALKALPQEERHIYCLELEDDFKHLQGDYNSGLLDLGWWCACYEI